MLPGLAGIVGFSGSTAGGGGGGGGGTQRQVMVLTPNGPVYVNTSASADKQYALPGGAYLNEQS